MIVKLKWLWYIYLFIWYWYTGLWYYYCTVLYYWFTDDLGSTWPNTDVGLEVDPHWNGSRLSLIVGVGGVIGLVDF